MAPRGPNFEMVTLGKDRLDPRARAGARGFERWPGLPPTHSSPWFHRSLCLIRKQSDEYHYCFAKAAGPQPDALFHCGHAQGMRPGPRKDTRALHQAMAIGIGLDHCQQARASARQRRTVSRLWIRAARLMVNWIRPCRLM